MKNPGRYPADRLGDGELAALTAHMNRGGGLFATGDHGFLGHGLGSAVDRVRGMRHWAPFAGPTGQDEVSMGGVRRNDSNAPGHDLGTQFNDQSDDVPQPLALKFYSTWAGLMRRARYPHPVLCSRYGRIDVFPDHPHEGETRVPEDLTQACTDGSPEYPDATDGSGQVVPEVVAWGTVPAGNNADGGKAPTESHRFAVVSTYDGHRARVGRVVCDSTWHHFVNVNLVGDLGLPGSPEFPAPGVDPSKYVGFLHSPDGRRALDKIREYYVNIGVWLATPERHTCMRIRAWWDVVWNDRVVEATLEDPRRSLDRIGPIDLFHIGVHAQDVLGRAAGPCQSIEWALIVFERHWPELRPWLNPWWRHEVDREPPLPVIDPQPFVAVALGGAAVALRERFPYPGERDLDELADVTEGILEEGARRALDQTRGGLADGVRDMLRLLE